MHIAWLQQSPFSQTTDGRLTSDLASARYRCLIPAEALKPLGHTSAVVGNLANATTGDFAAEFPALKADIAVIGKFFDAAALEQARIAKAAGCRVVADFCDYHFHRSDIAQVHRAMIGLADTVVASTHVMAEAIFRLTGARPAVVPDPFEGKGGAARFAPQADEIKLLWFGHPSNLDTLISVLPQLQTYATTQKLALTIVTGIIPDLQSFFRPEATTTDQLGSRLRAMVSANFSITLHPWSVPQLEAALQACDIVIIPSLPQEVKLVKGANRLIEALWAGRAVVAYPLPSYQEFAQACILTEDLVAGIKKTVSNPHITTQQIQLGQQIIRDHYAPAVVARKWQQVFETLQSPANQSQPMAAQSMSHPQALIRLNLGCGDKILPGYINVDVAPSRKGYKPDIQCDLRQLHCPDHYADEVMAIHVIEHFYYWEAEPLLREWLRVLKPGGKLILECPNLISACTEFLKSPDTAALPDINGKQTMWVFYGDPIWQDPLMCHRWAYTPASLGRLLMQTGFVNVRQEPAQFKMKEPRDMRVVGEKPLQGG